METQIPAGDGARVGTATGGPLAVELIPAKPETEPGAAPVEVVLTVHNLSNVVEQYTIEVGGLESDWVTAPVTSVSLFPQDRDQIRISLHPPKKPGLRAGSYPFWATVRARSGTADQTAHGVLTVRGVAIYRIVDLAPRRQTGRGQGTYKLQVANTGAADVRLALEGKDTEERCTFGFPKDAEAMVAAGSRTEVPIVVKPKKRPWVGEPRSYDFVVSARPIDARGESQNVAGQFTHQPLFRTLPIWPVLKWLLIALLLLGVLIALFAFGVPQEFGRRLDIARAQACGNLRNVPVLGGICPSLPPGVPPPTAQCAFEFGFKEFADAEPAMVGACTSNVAYDAFGNGIQFVQKGVLFWLKESNTVYLFTGDSVYAYVQGKPRLLDGSGRPV